MYEQRPNLKIELQNTALAAQRKADREPGAPKWQGGKSRPVCRAGVPARRVTRNEMVSREQNFSESGGRSKTENIGRFDKHTSTCHLQLQKKGLECYDKDLRRIL